MKFSRVQNDRLLDKLTEIVDIHNEAIYCCNILSKALWQNILMHFACSSLIICLCCMMILKSDGIERLNFIFYLCAYIQQIFNYSISGNMLINASENIKDAAYDFHWYKCDARVRKVIFVIMTRAQQKINVKVPFFEVSLETFTWVSVKLQFLSVIYAMSAFISTDYQTRWLIYCTRQNIHINFLSTFTHRMKLNISSQQ